MNGRSVTVTTQSLRLWFQNCTVELTALARLNVKDGVHLLWGILALLMFNHVIVVAMMKMGKIAPKDGIEPTSLAFWSSVLTITSPRLPDVVILPTATCIYDVLPKRAVHISRGGRMSMHLQFWKIGESEGHEFESGPPSFKPSSSQTNDFKTDTCCFLTWHSIHY